MELAVTMRLAPAVALLLDASLGEPPTRLHPTVWMGRLISAARAGRRSSAPLPSLAEGSAVVGGAALLAAALGVLGSRLARSLPRALGTLAEGAALKPALSLRALLEAGEAVEGALRAGDLPEARRLLSWHLVSRDTSSLAAEEVAGAAIESLAENLSDSLVAPLLAYRVAGLGGAYLYRLVNTSDAMLGYRTAELEWYGKGAARMDDALNLLPARLSAALLAVAAAAMDASGGDAVRLALRDAGRTPSPNAGWPMAAMAGALGVRLTKRGAYDLNAGAREPGPDDLRRARHLVGVAGGLACILASTRR